VTVFHRSVCSIVILLFCLSAPGTGAQSPPPTPLRILSASGFQPLPTLMVEDVEMVALDDLSAAFPMTVREDTSTGGLTVTWNTRTIVLTPDQPLASVGGRLISLPAAPRRISGRWHVPVEFIARALAPSADPRIELRKPSRLVIVGSLAVPRVVVRHETPGPQARLTIDISPSTPHTVVNEAERLVIHFEAAAIDATIPPFVSRGFIRAVRAADRAPQLLIELGPQFGSFRASDVPAAGGMGRLVIDVFPAVDTKGPSAPSPSTPAPGEPATPEVPPAIAPPPTAGLRTIVIDPGHGGDEDGARGAKGTLEKDVTLAVARRLKAGIEARLGTRVLLTRDDDRTVALDERAAMANNNKADLFISLHANASPGGGASGAEVFYLSLERHSEEARRVAEAEGTSMPVFGGGTREVDVMLWEMAQAHYIEQSAMLAGVVEQELRRVIPMAPNAIQQGPFRVLVGANMPAVLVELGYLSNPSQEQQLRSAEFAARAAQALLSAIVRFDASVRASATVSSAASGPARP
jgi:N-acetylmuramoyl-L-alanine amidase